MPVPRFPVSVVMECVPIASRWASEQWRPSAVLPLTDAVPTSVHAIASDDGARRWRFEGLAAELHGSGVSVNALGTSGLVMTPGVAVVSPHTPENASVEPDSAMAEAAVLLCGAPPGTLTGRIVYSMELLGRPLPDGPWALPNTF